MKHLIDREKHGRNQADIESFSELDQQIDLQRSVPRHEQQFERDI